MDKEEAKKLQTVWGDKPCDHPDIIEELETLSDTICVWRCVQCGKVVDFDVWRRSNRGPRDTNQSRLNQDHSTLLNLLAQVDKQSARAQELITALDRSEIYNSVDQLHGYLKVMKAKLDLALTHIGCEQ